MKYLTMAIWVRIEHEVVSAFNLAPLDLYRSSREFRYVWPRQVAMWLMRRLTTATLDEIGARLRKDGATARWAFIRVQGVVDSYPKTKSELLALLATIQEKIANETGSPGETTMAERPADLP